MRKKKKKWDIIWKKDTSKPLEIEFKKAFSYRTFITNFIDIAFSYIISIMVEEPLLTIAHYLRTLEWVYEFNIIAYFLFLLIIVAVIYIFYRISKTIRNKIVQKFEAERESFFLRFTSFIFAVLFVDIFIEPLLAFSFFIVTKDWTFNLGLMIDKIIASLLLLLIYLGIYSYYKLK